MVVDFLPNYISPFQAALATSILLFYFVYLFLKNNGLPPGPIGLPVLGYWPFLKPDTCHIQLTEMVAKYGDIFSFRVTGKLLIHLGSLKAIKEAHLTKSELIGERYSGFSLVSLLFQEGVINLNGELWKVLRKFFLFKFKEYGMNNVKENAINSIHDALNETLEELHKSKGQPIPITDVTKAKCSLIIRRILFKDKGITIEEMQELIHQNNIVASFLSSTNFLLYDNLAKYLIFSPMPSYWRMRHAINRMDDILLDIFNRHEREYDETQELDFVDCFIMEREKRRQKGDPTANYFTAKALTGSLSQFVTESVVTVGNFIGTFLMRLMEYPEEQEKIYKELIEVTGPERLPNIEDRPHLPYTNAFMYEVLRLSDFFPLYPSQQYTEQTSMQGYKIPKGAITLINVYAAHRNPESYEDPETFNPSRYLTSSNKTRPELPIMFGVGSINIKMIVVDFLTTYIPPFQAALATSILLFYFVYLFLKDNDLPPGPIGLPILGYWPFLKPETCHIQMTEMVAKYGDIFSFRVTGKLFIHLGSIKAIKEAHLSKSDCFEDRFSGFNLLSFVFQEGIMMLNGEPWKVLRKFFLSKFKEYGMNNVKDNAISFIHDTLNETIEELYKSKGQPIPITGITTVKCALVIRGILFNNQGTTIEEMQELLHQFNIVASTMNSTNFLLFGNLARFFIFPLMPSYWRMRRARTHIADILLGVVNKLEKEYDETHVSNIVDCFIKEREERRQKGDPTANYFTDISLVHSLSQFLTDGVLTVGLFIEALLICLVERPEEQDKIYKELLEVTGPDRLPTVEDKPNLPYTNAFMYEVLRLSDFFPVFPCLQCTKETEMRGYKIPKGAVTYLNIYAAHRNPEAFDDPETFNPSRYLTSSNAIRPELPVMFGVGKRACIGEPFTMIQAFLFITTIIQNFRLTYPEDSKSPSNKFWSQERLHLCAVPRTVKERS